jgi:hypothetical protein
MLRAERTGGRFSKARVIFATVDNHSDRAIANAFAGICKVHLETVNTSLAQAYQRPGLGAEAARAAERAKVALSA